MRRGVILGVVALSACSYRYGELRGGKPPRNTFDGVGWDGDLAYGMAMGRAASARNALEAPDYVSMNCDMYGAKIFAAALGGLLGGWAAAEGKTGVAMGVGAGALAVAFIPNCFATIGYHDRRPAPRPAAPPVREEPRDPPLRTMVPTDESSDPDGGTSDGRPPIRRGPPALNQARDRERPE